eukprot:5905220-Ditylum_brightwellii.AAC.1
MILSHHIFPGHGNFTAIYKAQQTRIMQDTVEAFFSAAFSLRSSDISTLLGMHKMCIHDSALWKQGYEEEYFGVDNLPVWGVINERKNINNSV